jgi:hypothetical protein
MDLMKNMDHFVWDIETLGTEADAVVTNIGIVKFNFLTGKVLASYETAFDVQEQLEAGRTVEASTLAFWFKQPEDAQKPVLQAMGESDIIIDSLNGALRMLSGWIQDNSTGADVSIWGNGPSFDNAIMKDLYRQAGLKYPFKYNADRCMRTIVDICRNSVGVDPKKAIENVGVVHDALDDAVYQAKVISYANNKISEATNPNVDNLDFFKTADLVASLIKRGGVENKVVPAYEKSSLRAIGPATLVLVPNREVK